MFQFWLVVGLTLVSCLADNPEENATRASVTTTTQPIVFPAQVESIRVETDVQKIITARVITRGTLPDPCSVIDQVTQNRERMTFVITLRARRQTDVTCEASPTPFEEAIDLDVSGLPAGIYVADVNGLKTSFAIERDNVADLENAVVGGQVWRDICPDLDSIELQDRVTRCRQTSDGRLIANGRLDVDEEGLAGVSIRLGSGSCPSIGLATTLTDANGAYLFSGLKAGDYCISVDATAIENQTVLNDGFWTTTSAATAGQVFVSLEPGESNIELHLGWSIQDQPPAAEAPTATPDVCTDVAAFLEDVTIPDDTVVTAGEIFTKTWLLRNVGTCTWTTDYAMIFIDGEAFGQPETTSLTVEVAPGESIELSLALSLPDSAEPGVYRGNWKLINDRAITFGIGDNANKPFWVQVEIEE